MPDCLVCGLPTALRLCAGCQMDLPYYEAVQQQRICQCCAKIFTIETDSDLDYCGACLVDSPAYQRTYAIFHYDYPINQLIAQAKYSADLVVLHQLAELMAQRFDIDSKPDCLIPIPMHAWHLRWRGFNQSLVLANYVGKVHQIPVDYRHCVCVRYPKKQASLNAKQRLKNVKGLFAVKVKNLAYQHVLIVDDVMTTGATVNELSKVLLQAGVKRVSVLCCARAML